MNVVIGHSLGSRSKRDRQFQTKNTPGMGYCGQHPEHMSQTSDECQSWTQRRMARREIQTYQVIASFVKHEWKNVSLAMRRKTMIGVLSNIANQRVAADMYLRCTP